MGRSFLRISKAVVSIHYLSLKYRVNDVMGVVKGDQRIARSFYATATKEAMQITLNTRGDDRKVRQKLVEEVEIVGIKLEEQAKTIKIG